MLLCSVMIRLLRWLLCCLCAVLLLVAARYLKEHRPILYNQLLMSEKLYPHLLEIDWTAQERVDTMLPHMMEAAGVTEELKACDPMRWVGLMNTLTAQIEEILIRELICS